MNDTTSQKSSRWDGLLLRFPDPLLYEPAWELQRALWERRRRLQLPDCLLLLEHEPVYTLGRHADPGFVRDSRVGGQGRPEAIPTIAIDRGGEVTYHGPGQLTAYFIADLRAHHAGVKPFVHRLEQAVIDTLGGFGIEAYRREGLIGVWTGDARNEAKIAAAGIRVAQGVSMHGIALNVAGCLDGFGGIVPCGLTDAWVTTMGEVLREDPAVAEVADRLAEAFGRLFEVAFRRVDLQPHSGTSAAEDWLQEIERHGRRGARRPSWLKMELPKGKTFRSVREALSAGNLYTVCEGARCPNRQECWDAGTATFMILGKSCTRRCRFCSVEKSGTGPVDSDEPRRLADAAATMNLKHVVVTSVTRDDLIDGGAGQFAETVVQIRRALPSATVEVLIPDFQGSGEALGQVLEQRPDVWGHNVETIPRLYPLARPTADYRRSLEVLRLGAEAGLRAKSGFMVGLGESSAEIKQLLGDLLAAGCRHVTIGQYLQPNRDSLTVKRYWAPAEFDRWADHARKLGFDHVESGPLVRSSYHAHEALQ